MATGINISRAEIAADSSYRLEYQGKRSAAQILDGPEANLETLLEVDGNPTNQVLYGDNLRIMRRLLRQSDVAGEVRLVYIDPPFASEARYENRDQEHAYTDSLTGAHYLEFLRERLILLHELLAEDGALYLHLDDRMICQARVLLDEIFGQDQFRNLITRRKCSSKNWTRKSYGSISDYVLFYTKSDNYVWNRPYKPVDESVAKWYNSVEEETGRRFMKVPIHAPGERNGATGQPWRGMEPPPGKHWQYTPKKLDKLDEKGRIYWSSNGNPRRKVYLDEKEGSPVHDIWLDFRDAHNQNIEITGYPTEKNPDLLRRIVKASSNEGDLVLDVFAGSGTTGAVAEELGRKWIVADNSKKAILTIMERLAMGTQRMGNYVSEDGGADESPTLFDGVLRGGLSLARDTDGDVADISSTELSDWVSSLQSARATS